MQLDEFKRICSLVGVEYERIERQFCRDTADYDGFESLIKHTPYASEVLDHVIRWTDSAEGEKFWRGIRQAMASIEEPLDYYVQAMLYSEVFKKPKQIGE